MTPKNLLRGKYPLFSQLDNRGSDDSAATGRRKRLPLLYGLTVTVAAFEVTPLAVAVTVAVPTATAVTSPVEEMVATELGVHVQVALAETLAVEPFEKVAVAVN